MITSDPFSLYSTMKILGISCYYHDSAAALIVDGRIVAAAQEERFTRKKHDSTFPKAAITYCLNRANITIDDIDIVSFYDKPFQKFERLLESYLAYAPYGLNSAWKGLPIWIKDKLWISDHIRTQLGFNGKLLFPEHHESHAASAFFPSPFQQAAVVTMDGVGEWATSSISSGSGNKIQMIAEQHFPHSLGLLYSAFTYYCGFRVNSGEYKLMGLAPYGKPIFYDLILDKLIDLCDDGSFKMDQSYFNYVQGLTMTNKKFDKLFGQPRRLPETEINTHYMDVAASIQMVTEEIVKRTVQFAITRTGFKNVCLAGGVALNCVANGKLVSGNICENLWIQPAAGDAGGALGAALFAWYQYLGMDRKCDNVEDEMQGSYLGPEWSDLQIEMLLTDLAIPHTIIENDRLSSYVAGLLKEGNVVGWFQGRMEFGPRALGNRSILGDPRSAEMQKNLNLKIKFRESFRPFAPSVLEENVDDYFKLNAKSPYMLLVAEVEDKHQLPYDQNKKGFEKLYQQRSQLPAITHVDNTARIQTVSKKTNPRFYELINEFGKLTGYPVLINTSFNVRGEPIVCTPEDAIKCFQRTEMDYLVMGRAVIDKSSLPYTEPDDSWKEEYVLD